MYIFIYTYIYLMRYDMYKVMIYSILCFLLVKIDIVEYPHVLCKCIDTTFTHM